MTAGMLFPQKVPSPPRPTRNSSRRSLFCKNNNESADGGQWQRSPPVSTKPIKATGKFGRNPATTVSSPLFFNMSAGAGDSNKEMIRYKTPPQQQPKQMTDKSHTTGHSNPSPALANVIIYAKAIMEKELKEFFPTRNWNSTSTPSTASNRDYFPLASSIRKRTARMATPPRTWIRYVPNWPGPATKIHRCRVIRPCRKSHRWNIWTR